MDNAILTPFEAFLYGISSFVINVLSELFNACLSVSIILVIFYVICRFLICENDIEEWRNLSSDMRSELKDLARSFKAAMPGVVESAKFWSEEKIREIKEARIKE